MQAQPKQKKSLFSQRIKQARINQQDSHPNTLQEASFPKALSINLQTTQPGPKQNDSQMKDQTCKRQGKRFADMILGTALKEEEVRKIQSQNEESIRNMSEEQVRKYQDMLVKQMPPEFLSKFKRGVVKMHQNQSKSNETVTHCNKEQEQMIEEKNQQIMETKGDRMSDQEEQVDEANSIGTIEPILFNIQTNEVEYNHTGQTTLSESRLITMRDLKHMVQNQNNQTQIVGSKLVDKLCQTLFGQPEWKRAIPILYLSNQYFHLVVLACDVYTNLLRSLMHQIEKTKFKSCWFEMIDALSNCIPVTCAWLSRAKEGLKMIQGVVEFMKSQLLKKSHFFTQSSRASQLLRKKLQQTTGSLAMRFTYSQASIEQLAIHPKEVVDLIVIEELQALVNRPRYRFHTMLQNVASFCSDCPTEAGHQHLLISVVYPIAHELVLREYRSNKLDKQVMAVKEVVYQWLTRQMGTLINVRGIKESMSENEQGNLFKCLHIIKILAPNDYAALLTNKSEQQMDQVPVSIMTSHQVFANLLTLLNIDEYFNPTAKISNISQKSTQIENVEHMLQFLATKLTHPTVHYLKQISACLFVDLMVIFLNYLDVPQQGTSKNAQECPLALTYHDLNGDILNKALAALSNAVIQTNQQNKLWGMISQERMKSLIQSYNYDSFGDYCFTRLLAFLAVTSPPNTQAMIIEEVMTRYPFLFCYAAEGGLYGPSSLYTQGPVTPEMTTVYQMACFNKKFDHNNLFLRYLSKK